MPERYLENFTVGQKFGSGRCGWACPPAPPGAKFLPHGEIFEVSFGHLRLSDFVAPITAAEKSGGPAMHQARSSPASSESGSDAHDNLAEIAPVEHPDERFRSLVQAVHDVLAIANAAVRDARSDLAQEFGVVLFSKFGVYESAHCQTLRQDLAHCGR